MQVLCRCFLLPPSSPGNGKETSNSEPFQSSGPPSIEPNKSTCKHWPGNKQIYFSPPPYLCMASKRLEESLALLPVNDLNKVASS